jgi:hypothetical protein
MLIFTRCVFTILEFSEPNSEYYANKRYLCMSFHDTIHIGFVILFLCAPFKFGSENSRDCKATSYEH